ncbi:MAG: Maf family protein [Ignavibacteria bacterium]|jgi:septum formation protein|nr:Maf family protein [Ignavibacteria bacterium]
MRTILASQSPRRIHLLKSIGIDFEVLPADVDERISTKMPPSKYCKYLAERKANHIAKQINTPATIIAADTIVVQRSKIINKPMDAADALRILRQLSGTHHFVYTGVAVIDTETARRVVDYSRTTVYFRELSDSEIRAYISTGSPMDKAGAYGIQDDYGALFVSRIEGCYNNVIGLPLEKLWEMLGSIR